MKKLKIVVVRNSEDGHIENVFSTEDVDVLLISSDDRKSAPDCIARSIDTTVVKQNSDLREAVFDGIEKDGHSLTPFQLGRVSQFLN